MQGKQNGHFGVKEAGRRPIHHLARCWAFLTVLGGWHLAKKHYLLSYHSPPLLLFLLYAYPRLRVRQNILMQMHILRPLLSLHQLKLVPQQQMTQ